MTIQLSTTYRNAMLDQFESTVGTDAILRIYDLTASAPADCAASITGTLVAEITCPTNWMSAAALGQKTLLGTWLDASANNNGTADFFRLYDSTGTTCHMQGTVTVTGGGGDMTLDSVSFTAGQSFSINTFTLTAPGA